MTAFPVGAGLQPERTALAWREFRVGDHGVSAEARNDSAQLLGLAGADVRGRVGGLALAYFITMSVVALGIGLVVGNLIHPGAGLNLTAAAAKSGKAALDVLRRAKEDGHAVTAAASVNHLTLNETEAVWARGDARPPVSHIR